ncbi:hypothetical protein BDW67DRAFT_170983 [Aspergillus spinulosporus]
MSEYGSSPSSTWSNSYGFGNGRERGARRKKVFEYLKAANELRQSYAASWAAQRNASRDLGDDYLNTPGAFPDVEIARSGDEEMVIFPSYARRLDRDRIAAQNLSQRQSLDSIDEYRGHDGMREREDEWETFDDKDAVVAVDVRGWVYAPYRGPMTRKQRLVVALARKLSGVPAPISSETGLDGTSKEDDRIPPLTEAKEEEIVNSEAQFIIKTADKQNEMNLKAASEGLDEEPAGRLPQRTPTNISAQSSSTQLSKDELLTANGHLVERIKPFLSNPMAGMAVTVFFFNDENSQSKNIMTNDSGHFSIRASLSFVPTHVRVLASEDLSAVKNIEVIEPTGVSMISDIDDTVKHSAIASGAKEMCRNIFARELSDLTIEGVTDWYNAMVKAGVQVHYVSNSPWQLYPLLDRFFKMVGLPPGSFHLKQYSGIFQGIFEPTLERKKGNLERILQDFPDRKFILVGDSGESDLEVYTDLAITNPGRIIGIFIRDVTTPERTTFFEKSVNHLEHTPPRTNSTPELADHSDLAPNRPTLPPRPPRTSSEPAPRASSAEREDLIDLSDESDKPVNTRTPPTIPSKPSALRSVTNIADLADKPSREAIKRKPAPPLPRRSAGKSDPVSAGATASTRSSSADKNDSNIENRGEPLTNNRVARLQDLGSDGAGISKPAPPPPPPRRSITRASSNSPSQVGINTNCPVPERPPRFAASSSPPSQSSSPSRQNAYPGAPSMLRSPASNASLGRTSTSSSDTYAPSRTSTPSFSASPRAPLPNKREELWRRRWERASEILADKGVVLGSWRVGKDVQDVCLWLVKEALKQSSVSGKKEATQQRESESKWS